MLFATIWKCEWYLVQVVYWLAKLILFIAVGCD